MKCNGLKYQLVAIGTAFLLLTITAPATSGLIQNATTVSEVIKKPIADTYVASGRPNKSFHTEGGLWVGNDEKNGNQVRRSLLKFDLSGIPVGSTITAATLVLNLGGTTTNDGQRNIKVSRIIRDTGGDWLANKTEEMTWNRHLQLDQTDTNSSTISVGTGLTEYQWNLAAMVKDWLQDTSHFPHFGLLVQDTNNSNGQHERAFWSKDCLDSDCGAGQRPYLLIEFAAPTPTPTVTPTPTSIPTPTSTPVQTKPTPGISIARLTNSPTGVINDNDAVLYLVVFSSNNSSRFELSGLQITATVPQNAKLVADALQATEDYTVEFSGIEAGSHIIWRWKTGFPNDETAAVSYRVLYSPTVNAVISNRSGDVTVSPLLHNDGVLIQWSYNGEFNSIRSNFVCNPACPSQHLPMIMN